ncbi:sulfate ABC transporter substrate-binding protein [Rhizosaccharibacter radicis]|uniref:Sulfate ABC transporter substrate-binding protein n=1 Tax=Rhizosaccharibacter radicis TaxID=2782605 RepID=A0ABT1W119_9PROT|nr:sulfate ABC transporter substrate-binding protein [Acetobacteraceae bacterium KSS12]
MPVAASAQSLLNVSYDPTRELYKDIDKQFSTAWKKQTGETVSVATSHGGSGAQARAVLDGLQADVVTLGIASDIDALAARGLLARDWSSRLPNHAVPYTSTIVFLVRSGNPKHIRDWPDLVRDGVSVVTPNPKTSSGGRWSYIAAYLWALHANNNDESKAETFLTQLYRHVPILDTGARGATNSFVQRGQGDVLLAWEDEALLAAHDLGAGRFDVVYPSASVVAEPVVAVVDSVVGKKNTARQADGYLRFLYTPQGQEIIAAHHYRAIDPAVAARHAADFPRLVTYDVESAGGWSVLQPKHFGDGGVFDRITRPAR